MWRNSDLSIDLIRQTEFYVRGEVLVFPLFLFFLSFVSLCLCCFSMVLCPRKDEVYVFRFLMKMEMKNVRRFCLSKNEGNVFLPSFSSPKHRLESLFVFLVLFFHLCVVAFLPPPYTPFVIISCPFAPFFVHLSSHFSFVLPFAPSLFFLWFFPFFFLRESERDCWCDTNVGIKNLLFLSIDICWDARCVELSCALTVLRKRGVLFVISKNSLQPYNE